MRSPEMFGKRIWILLVLLLTTELTAEDKSAWTDYPAPARSWRYVVLHHSASETGSVESIDVAHRSRKDAAGNPWRGIGYHFVIGNGHGMEDGEVKSTFRWKEQTTGAHAGESQYNEYGVGICLIGDFRSSPPSDKQLDSLTHLMSFLQEEWQIPAERVVTHGQIKSTACPGRQFTVALQRRDPRYSRILLPASAETMSPPVVSPTRRPVNSP